MKIRIDQEVFAETVSRAQSIMERKSTRPILENILLETTTDGVILSATDLRVSLTQKAACEVVEAGSISLLGRKLHEIIREVPKGEVELEVQDNAWVTITAGKSTFHVPGTPSEEFPTIPQPPDQFIKLPAETFDQMVAKTLFSASSDETRIYLCGVFFKEWTDESGKNMLKMVATDGHRLSMVDKELEKGLGIFTEGIIVPKKGVGELKALVGMAEGDFEIAHAEGKLYARQDDVFLSVNLIEASFPNYEQVIPDSGGAGIMVSCDAFRDALKRVSILSDQETRSVVVDMGSNTMTLSSDNPSMGDAKETIDADYAGDTLRVAFNANYLMDILKVMKDEALRMEIKDSLSPTLFMGTDKDAGFLSVVMPMRVD